MKLCKSCHVTHGDTSNFCTICGESLPKVEVKKYGGIYTTQGLFRVTLTADIEYMSKDHAEEDVRYGCIGEGELPAKEISITLIKLTATKKTHPYECINCINDGEIIVEKSTDIYCEFCGFKDWRLRK